MSIGDTFSVGLITMFLVEINRHTMFDDRFGQHLPEWWTRTAGREAFARIMASTIGGGIILIMMGKMGSDDGTTDATWWKPCAGILGAVLLRQIWWATNGKFTRAWEQWNAEAKAKSRQE